MVSCGAIRARKLRTVQGIWRCAKRMNTTFWNLASFRHPQCKEFGKFGIWQSENLATLERCENRQKLRRRRGHASSRPTPLRVTHRAVVHNNACTTKTQTQTKRARARAEGSSGTLDTAASQCAVIQRAVPTHRVTRPRTGYIVYDFTACMRSA